MAPNDLTIRTARTGDDAPLAALDRAAWSTLSDVSPRPPAVRDLFDERHTPDQYLVADLAGGIVGYVRNVPATPLEANRHVRQIPSASPARRSLRKLEAHSTRPGSTGSAKLNIRFVTAPLEAITTTITTRG